MKISNALMIKLASLINSFRHLLYVLILRINPFWIELSYFIFLSLVGFGALKASRPRTPFSPRNIDMYFTSVSAITVSSMSTVEMEVLSNAQLILLTILILAGGEVFTSILGLQLLKFKEANSSEGREDKFNTNCKRPDFLYPHKFLHQIELSVVSYHQQEYEENPNQIRVCNSRDSWDLSFSSIKLLSYIVLCYLLVVHVIGSSLIYIYMKFIPTATQVLKEKGLNLLTFAVFTTVSTFANCGFVPTNENMMVFKKNSGLLLIIIPQILLGNTLYPACLRLVIWISEKVDERAELTYMLKNPRKLGYNHLFSGLQARFLAVSVFAFILVQFILFCSLEWHSEAIAGLNPYQKLVASLFEVLNSRHAGESVFDLSMLTPAVLVLFVVMMYLPPYTSFMPIEEDESVSETEKKSTKGGKNILEHFLFSQLTYLVIFMILICITEKEKMKEDPLNFNVLSIIFEVISAYGNVGFSMGYSCARQIKVGDNCINAAYGFAGKWSSNGKLILIVVMFFGRLKKFGANGGKSWRFL